MRTNRQGFTLIELIIVVVVIGILIGGAVAMSNVGAAADFELRSVARRVAGTVETARESLETTQRTARIVYDLDEQKIQRFRTRKPASDEDAPADDEEDAMQLVSSVRIGNPEQPETSRVWLQSVQTYDGKVYQSGKLLIDFRPTGSATGHVVVLRSREGEFMSVELNPLTGTARIYAEEKKIEEPEKDS